MTHDTLQRLVAEFVRSFGLLNGDRTPCGKPIAVSEAHALTELAERGEGEDGLSQNELASRLRLEKSTVSRLVAAMERRGWVERRKDAADTRIWRLSLSPSGRRLAEDIAAARREKFGRLAAALGEGELLAVEDGLRRLLEALRAETETEREKEEEPNEK